MFPILTPRGVVFHVARLLPGLLILLAACAPRLPAGIPTAAPATTMAATGTPATPHSAEIRFGLVGVVNGGNVWALFDSKGYSYNDYAMRAAYWPRLYNLSIPGRRFEPQAASGMPSAIQPEGVLFTGTASLRSDLQWSDGSSFTADDVAFTVNTALAFQLGFDWQSSYDPAWLDHAEAVDPHTVKFYFKHEPNVVVWQYGALQGPVVQRKYWAPKLGAAAALLPTAGDLLQIESLSAQVTDLQKQVNALVAAGLTATGDQTRQLQIELQTQQGNLDGARNSLAKAQGIVDAAMQAARASLYSLDDPQEPTLGTWMPAGNTSSTWTNKANPSHPFEAPNFDRAVYMLYPDEASAITAIKDGQLNGILESGGVSSALTSQQIAGAQVISNQASSAHFLVLNPSQWALADPVLRHAWFCAIDRSSLVYSVAGMPLGSLIPDANGDWSSPQASISCVDGPGAGPGWDPFHAVDMMKAAGYTWATEPSRLGSGSGLRTPNGSPLPTLMLLRPSLIADPGGAQAADYIVDAGRFFGLPIQPGSASPADIRYALFYDHQYGAAIVAWRLSIYPGYLCDWFGEGNPFGYGNTQIAADCQALDTTSDLQAAHEKVADILSVLAQDPAFMPLYSGRTNDVTRGITYPFDYVQDGLSGVFGAPSLAIPSPP